MFAVDGRIDGKVDFRVNGVRKIFQGMKCLSVDCLENKMQREGYMMEQWYRKCCMGLKFGIWEQ